ncbi:MAG: cobalamin-binding protein [Elusimicrobia bacterium]|nr:cobalamin-binding protein [Elusimicrobiota bacterium]
MRAISLIASATEIVCALGLESVLVGRSHECDFPPSVKALPRVTEPSIDVGGGSAEIDRRVREAARDALSIYRVDDALLASLKPDVLITQTQCEVCAVSLKDVEAALAKRIGLRPRIVPLSPNSLSDLRADVRRVARALGAPLNGEELIAALDDRMDRAAARIRERPRRSVAVIEWLDPLMSAGNWTPTLVARAGGDELFGVANRHSGAMTWDALKAADPQVLIAAPCGFDIARTQSELAALAGRPGFSELRAVREGRAYVADGNAYFNRPGPRVVETLEGLIEMIHPEAPGFDRKGEVYEPLSSVSNSIS